MQRNDTSPGDNVSTQNIADSTTSSQSTDLANARADMSTLTNMDISPDLTSLSQIGDKRVIMSPNRSANSTNLSQIGERRANMTTPDRPDNSTSSSQIGGQRSIMSPNRSANSTNLSQIANQRANMTQDKSADSTSLSQIANQRANMTTPDRSDNSTSSSQNANQKKLKYIKPDRNLTNDLTNDDSFSNQSLASIYSTKYGSNPDLSRINHEKWLGKGGLDGSFDIPNIRSLFSPRAYSSPKKTAIKRSNPYVSGFRTRTVRQRNLVNSPKKNREDFFWN